MSIWTKVRDAKNDPNFLLRKACAHKNIFSFSVGTTDFWRNFVLCGPLEQSHEPLKFLWISYGMAHSRVILKESKHKVQPHGNFPLSRQQCNLSPNSCVFFPMKHPNNHLEQFMCFTFLWDFTRHATPIHVVFLFLPNEAYILWIGCWDVPLWQHVLLASFWLYISPCHA